ncbi:hypothetical protein K0M31_017937 [Melipona bicolor]|uniref:Caspase activity and apoptosis inhibitor 1 n=1 Tax=Melipona bicolor TaxID=60889 RepID=A0AA40G5T2_9HYME|nr:hypothetical protein K0M31_017937 [Melipona bicolor]
MSKGKKSAYSSEEGSSSSGTSSSLSSDEEVDARDLKPIKEYLSDRRELARQLFKSVKAEKIQMMLPQTLKKMDFVQLEKWCANELSGMSKSRILCILNGKPMLESSDTSESDDSGPSLEIISDTEEWFTDDDMSKKEEGSKGKIKKERIKQKGKSQLNKKNDSKSISKKVSDTACKNIQVKKENDTDKSKEKEGDSLLDLLELEMRARAIRALIRKEEDIIPNTLKSTTSNDISNENVIAKTEQDEIKEKENCRRQLERIISAQQNSTAEDEDVVLVVQPTPTIELLSSDSEGEPHGGVRVNKKLQNERVIEVKDNINHIENRDINTVRSVSSLENSKENKSTKSSIDTRKEIDSTHKTEAFKRNHSNNVPYQDNQSKSSSKKRKTKKRSHVKEQSKNVTSEVDTHGVKSGNASQNIKDTKSDDCSSQDTKLDEKEHENSVTSKMTNNNSLSTKQESTEALNIPDKVGLDEEKSIDLDEIIDLDDYCDDMDDIENNENDKNNKTVESKECKSQTESNSAQKSNGTETWASRYYQTDDVQNVIKESKIQSEIRKRLRERQRLSKLNTSPNKNLPSSPPVVEATNNKVTEKHPMGSVDEYLALKHTAATSLSSNSSSMIKDNVVSANTHVDADKLIENDHTSNVSVYSKSQMIDKESTLNDNANINDTSATKKENVVNAINIMNPG